VDGGCWGGAGVLTRCLRWELFRFLVADFWAADVFLVAEAVGAAGEPSDAEANPLSAVAAGDAPMEEQAVKPTRTSEIPVMILKSKLCLIK
jgi:hypothetical protein